MRWWNEKEDGEQASRWRGRFGGDVVTEQFAVRNVPPLCTIWQRPALLVRAYEDGRVTVVEREWRPER